MATAPTKLTITKLVLKDGWGNATTFDFAARSFYSDSRQEEHPLSLDGTGDVLTMDISTLTFYGNDVPEFDLRQDEPLPFTLTKG